MSRFAPARPHKFSGLTGEPAYRQFLRLRRVVLLAMMGLTSIGGCHAATKKAAHADPRLANVELRLRLLLVASGASARGYLEFMKSLVE